MSTETKVLPFEKVEEGKLALGADPDSEIFVYYQKYRREDGEIIHDINIDHPDCVVILPLTEDEEVVAIDEFKRNPGEVIFTLPAGKIKLEDGSPLEAARRELKEETGYQAKTIKPMGPIGGYVQPMINYSLVKVYFFLAEGCKKVAEPQEKGIEVVLMDIDEWGRKIKKSHDAYVHLAAAFSGCL